MERTQNKNHCISKKEVEQLLTSGEKLLIVGVRSGSEYKGLHIEGAINIQVDVLHNKLDEFGGARLIITACGKGGSRSKKGAEILIDNGLKATWLCGGTLGWIKK